MNKQEKINSLKKEIAQLESEMRNCKHDFKEAIYDPETVRVQDDRNGYEEHGSDRWPKMSFHDETKPRWSRECKHCGHKEYTYEQAPVVKEYKPKFKD